MPHNPVGPCPRRCSSRQCMEDQQFVRLSARCKCQCNYFCTHSSQLKCQIAHTESTISPRQACPDGFGVQRIVQDPVFRLGAMQQEIQDACGGLIEMLRCGGLDAPVIKQSCYQN